MIVSNISKFLSLLSKKQIFKVSGLLLLLLIGMFLEIIGIGILLPTLKLFLILKFFIVINTFPLLLTILT